MTGWPLASLLGLGWPLAVHIPSWINYPVRPKSLISRAAGFSPAGSLAKEAVPSCSSSRLPLLLPSKLRVLPLLPGRGTSATKR
jgi:hypothetical protein